MLTGTVAGALYAVARLAALFSLLSLGYGLVLAAFVVPKVRAAGADGQQFAGGWRRWLGADITAAAARAGGGAAGS